MGGAVRREQWVGEEVGKRKGRVGRKVERRSRRKMRMEVEQKKKKKGWDERKGRGKREG